MPGEPTSTGVVLIDGHNLAHHLFHLNPGQRLSTLIAGQLIAHFEQYRLRFDSPAPDFEIFFDGGVIPHTPDPTGIRVMAAGHQNNADRVILDRFHFHTYAKRACLIITNDQEIIDNVQSEAGAALLAFDFVVYANPRSPIFIPPADLLALLPKVKSASPAHPLSIRLEPLRTQAPARTRPVKPRREKHPAPPTVSAPLPPQEQKQLEPVCLPQLPLVEPHRYRLSIHTWPVAEGLRFLKTSVCKQHRGQLLEQLEGFSVEELRPADLEDLAKILLLCCASEPNFICRGSFMDRVRLALLVAGPGGLSLYQLAASTGLPSEGLHRHIKQKGAGWLEIDF